MTYSSADVCQLLQWPASRLYGYVKDGLVQPERVAGAYQFTFNDLVVLRAANQLLEHNLPARRVRKVLRMLVVRLASNRPLSTVGLAAVGDAVAVREDGLLWEVESGQAQINFDVPAVTVALVTPGQAANHDDVDCYDAALELEADDPEAATGLYLKAIEADDRHADAHINVGRLEQQAGRLEAAREHYERALELEPDNALAHFNMGTLMEDLEMVQQAELHYLQATGKVADAHLNLARLYASWGDTRKAIRHLRTVRFWSEPDNT